MKLHRIAVSFLIVCCLSLPAAFAQSANQATQTPPIKLGTSGGNIEDHSSAFCCSGTLGSLVTKGGSDFILSNNHVLARTGQATNGEDISQPGLIDSGCRPVQIVADYDQTASSGAPLGSSNVDAALATVRADQVTSTGEIIGVGVPSSTIADPGLVAVAKSGRTTGLTCGTIGSISTSVSVQYQQGCNQGKKFTITYSNQVVVNSSSFSAGGDSGSLIVTAADAQPIALLFAGSSTTTIGNPMREVADKLGVTFVGSGNHAVSCTSGGGGGGGGNGGGHGKPHNGFGQEVSQAAIQRATYIKEQHAGELMNTLGVQGVGVGATEQGNPAIIVYLIEGQPHGRIPSQIEGVPTRIIVTDRFRAYGWNERLEPHPTEVSCKK